MGSASWAWRLRAVMGVASVGVALQTANAGTIRLDDRHANTTLTQPAKVPGQPGMSQNRPSGTELGSQEIAPWLLASIENNTFRAGDSVVMLPVVAAPRGGNPVAAMERAGVLEGMDGFELSRPAHGSGILATILLIGFFLVRRVS